MIQYVRGDLFELGLPAIGHGVNCQGVMGAGIASQFRRRYPDMYTAYRQACLNRTVADLTGKCMPWQQGPGEPLILNMFTQKYPGACADPRLIRSSMLRAVNYCISLNIGRLGIPLIGCGIGGLDWEKDVLPRIEDLFVDSDHGLGVELNVVLLPEPVVQWAGEQQSGL